MTVRFSDGEAAQLARVAGRYRLSESGAINVDVLRLVGELNAVGVNVNQIARQDWTGVEPDIDALRRATATLLAIVKELSS